MTFHEKLRRLLEDMNRTKVARRAGILPTNINNYLRRESVPGIDAALKLARALGIDPGWLIDDSKGWPPVRVREEELQTTAA